MSKLIRIGSFPHLSAISKESMAEKIVELENRNKELEAENKRLEFDKLNNTAEISNLKEELGMANRRIRKLAGDNR